MSEWNFRLAKVTDAEALARFAAHNVHIDADDLKSGMGANNPTVIMFVVEKDGKPVAAAPVYLSAVLAHLIFDPEAEGSDKMRGLNMLKDGVEAFMIQNGIREITTLSDPKYPISAWALNHGFEEDPRTLLRLDLNKEMVEAH